MPSEDSFLLDETGIGPVDMGLHIPEGASLDQKRQRTHVADVEMNRHGSGLARQLLALVQVDAFAVELDRDFCAAAPGVIVDADDTQKTLVLTIELVDDLTGG